MDCFLLLFLFSTKKPAFEFSKAGFFLLLGIVCLFSLYFGPPVVGSAFLPVAIKNPLTFGGCRGMLKMFFVVFALALLQQCRGAFYVLVSSHFFLLPLNPIQVFVYRVKLFVFKSVHRFYKCPPNSILAGRDY